MTLRKYDGTVSPLSLNKVVPSGKRLNVPTSRVVIRGSYAIRIIDPFQIM